MKSPLKKVSLKMNGSNFLSLKHVTSLITEHQFSRIDMCIDRLSKEDKLCNDEKVVSHFQYTGIQYSCMK